MTNNIIDLDTLKQISRDVLKYAKQAGASSAETEVSYGTGQNVSVRMGETENIEYNRDKGISVTVYSGQQKGHASSSDLSPQALKDTVEAACNIAKYTAKDEFCGLADANLMAKEILDLDLYHPWNICVDEAIEIAKQCEAAAFAVDEKRIRNSEGAGVSNSESVFAYANSYGFVGGYPSCVIALVVQSLLKLVTPCSVIIGIPAHVTCMIWNRLSTWVNWRVSALFVG